MSWLQRIAQVENLQQMLIEVAQGIRDINQVSQYIATLSPAPMEVCEMINTVGNTYPGADTSMHRLFDIAGCTYTMNNANNATNMSDAASNIAPEGDLEAPSMEIA